MHGPETAIPHDALTESPGVDYSTLDELKRLDEHVPLVRLGPLLDALHERKFPPHEVLVTPLEAPNFNADRARAVTKAEINAMSAYFIEPIWRNADAWIVQHPPGLGHNFQNKDGTSVLVPVSEDEVQAICRNLASPRQVADVLHRNTIGVLSHEAGMWDHRMAERKNLPKAEQGFDDQVYARYSFLVRTSDVTSADDQAHHIARGITTAFHVMWDGLAVIPEAYAKSRGKMVSAEKLVGIANHSEALMMALAAMNVRLISKDGEFMKLLRKGIIDGPLDPSCFFVSSKDGKERLEIKKEVFEEMKSIMPEKMIATTRCPALYAKGAHGKNVIQELYAWIRKLSERFYYPNIDIYNQHLPV